MDKKTLSKQVIIEKGGIAKTSDFVAAGIPAVDIVNLCNTGYLERIRHGYYQLADRDTSSEEQLIATLIPKAIICVESALFHYGYSDFAPRKWSIAVPRSSSIFSPGLVSHVKSASLSSLHPPRINSTTNGRYA